MIFLFALLLVILVLVILFLAWMIISRHFSQPCPVWMRWSLDTPFSGGLSSRTKRTLQYLGLTQGMNVLDAGCGPGRLTIPMAREVGATGHVTAMDLQEGMLDEVRKKAGREDLGNITFLQAGLGEGKLESSAFDRVVLITVLGEVPDRDAAMRELCWALKPGGFLLVEETIRDPHFQGRSTVMSLAGPLGLTEKAFYGGRFNFTILLEKQVRP